MQNAPFLFEPKDYFGFFPTMGGGQKTFAIFRGSPKAQSTLSIVALMAMAAGAHERYHRRASTEADFSQN